MRSITIKLTAYSCTSILVKLHTIILLLIRQKPGIKMSIARAGCTHANAVCDHMKEAQAPHWKIGMTPGAASSKNLVIPSFNMTVSRLMSA